MRSPGPVPDRPMRRRPRSHRADCRGPPRRGRGPPGCPGRRRGMTPHRRAAGRSPGGEPVSPRPHRTRSVARTRTLRWWQASCTWARNRSRRAASARGSAGRGPRAHPRRRRPVGPLPPGRRRRTSILRRMPPAVGTMPVAPHPRGRDSTRSPAGDFVADRARRGQLPRCPTGGPDGPLSHRATGGARGRPPARSRAGGRRAACRSRRSSRGLRRRARSPDAPDVLGPRTAPRPPTSPALRRPRREPERTAAAPGIPARRRRGAGNGSSR